MKAIGYAEFFEEEDERGRGSPSSASLRDRIVIDTIHYAKRQETFFRGLTRSLAERHQGACRLAVIEASAPREDAARLAALLDDAIGPGGSGREPSRRDGATHA